jgi:hypothetical protein
MGGTTIVLAPDAPRVFDVLLIGAERSLRRAAGTPRQETSRDPCISP